MVPPEFASPTEYGLGRNGWVTARFPRGASLPVDILRLWIDESYRAVAPKRLVAQLETAPARPRSRRMPKTVKTRASRR